MIGICENSEKKKTVDLKVVVSMNIFKGKTLYMYIYV